MDEIITPVLEPAEKGRTVSECLADVVAAETFMSLRTAIVDLGMALAKRCPEKG